MAVDIKELKSTDKEVALNKVTINNEDFYKISHCDALRPFFMSIVSDSDHWMFISSNGGLSAGRKNSNYALFPYYTDDKITELAHTTGSRTIFQIEKEGKVQIWEPFIENVREAQSVTRNLFKSEFGNSIIFEEINHELGLTYSYQWCNSDRFGFVRHSKVVNTSGNDISVKVLDGIQNIMPHGVNPDLQVASSNLVEAYKRSQLDKDSGLGMFALSAIIVDRAEPSEALKTNVVWSLGFDNPLYLLSSLQLDTFRKGDAVKEEADIKAEKGAYFVVEDLYLSAGTEKNWMMVAEVNQDANDVARIIASVKSDTGLHEEILEDIKRGTRNLVSLVGASDGLQLTADRRQNSRHFSNTLFNIMRGGIFDDNYHIEKGDFMRYLQHANKDVSHANAQLLDQLASTFNVEELKALTSRSDDADFKRLATEYLPLKFSRRHGDPSRPWNKFSINLRDEDGEKVLDYEGNWRDIFQNWEALAKSYPEFLEGMIFKFLNASTFDGYNPYRVTKDGFDWEIIEEHDPWSYIGYWGDHQIIYLQKFLESIVDHKPDKLRSYFDEDIFVYANVPYKIKDYDDIVQNPKDTITFDTDLDHFIRSRREEVGADGALLQDNAGNIHRVNFLEKILAMSLAKVSNFIPEAGIWMNTQRPEWNDANNALVGNGVSMVTLYYLRRFFKHFGGVLEQFTSKKGVEISQELHEFFLKTREALKDHKILLQSSFTDAHRKQMHDQLGKAASDYRNSIYQNGFTGDKQVLKVNQLSKFIALATEYLDHSIKANRRDDNMYHAYNLITIKDHGTQVSYLDEMLEGQVAALSAGSLKPEQCLAVLDSMKTSRLFRDDQYSFVLYPNKDLLGFLEKNTIPQEAVERSQLLQKLVADGETSIIERDINGNYHFNGNFNNANSLKQGLSKISSGIYADLVKNDSALVLDIFEEVFNHKAFTGRSGTFYGFEGLGSIYWHMVSKLLLAVQECCLQAIHQNASDEVVGRLLEHYYEINEGIGVHKSPALYGAFPTDPYSHTPQGKGAQQPGMTGQVKEDILSRIGELGVFVHQGQLTFNPCLLRANEFIQDEKIFNYVNVNSAHKSIALSANSIAFTYCQVPMIYHIADENSMKITYADGRIAKINSWALDADISAKVFSRTGEIATVEISVKKTNLK